MKLAEFIPLLQVATSPVILISGVGLLLLTLSNRFHHVTDRARSLMARLREPDAPRESLRQQLHMLAHRAWLIQLSLRLAVGGAICAAVLMMLLFLAPLIGIESAVPFIAAFMGCVGCVAAALGVLLRETGQSLLALQLELREIGLLPDKGKT